MQHALKLYALLFVNLSNARHANISSSVKDPTNLYLRCAVTLQKSCEANGIEFALLTNDNIFIETNLAAIGARLKVVKLDFDRNVPKSLPFYEAHFKLDVIRAFGTGALGARVALVDIDAVITKPMPHFNDPRSIWVYDITSTMAESYGADVISRDLALAGALETADRWFGGEFLLSTSEAFAELAEAIDQCWPVYLENVKKLSHVGDETVLSAALSRMPDGMIIDAGRNPDLSVVRYWSVRTLHKPQPLGNSLSASIVHLPADKDFLAACADEPFEARHFQDRYVQRLRRKILRARMANAVDWLRRATPKRYSPRLS